MDNPYQTLQASPAVFEPSTVAASSPYVFRPATIMTPTLKALYAMLIPLLPAVAVVTIMIENIDEQTASDLDLLWMMAGVTAIFAVLLLFFMTVVVHCIWTNRMNKNARALGARDMEHTPGWAVGYYFIPIANLFKPFQVTSEIYRASRPGHDEVAWKDEPTPAILNAWWAAWIIGNIVNRVSDRLPDPNLAGVVSLVAACLTAIAGICAFIWVGQIHRRQMETHAFRNRLPVERMPDEFDRV